MSDLREAERLVGEQLGFRVGQGPDNNVYWADGTVEDLAETRCSFEMISDLYLLAVRLQSELLEKKK